MYVVSFLAAGKIMFGMVMFLCLCFILAQGPDYVRHVVGSECFCFPYLAAGHIIDISACLLFFVGCGSDQWLTCRYFSFCVCSYWAAGQLDACDLCTPPKRGHAIQNQIS